MDDDGMAALAAAAALLAAADGADEGKVRERLRGKAVEGFEEQLGHLREDAERGEIAAFQAIKPMRGDAERAFDLMRAVMDAGGGTRALAPAQAATARRICEALNLSPTQFGL